jgi:hypothetical protein
MGPDCSLVHRNTEVLLNLSKWVADRKYYFPAFRITVQARDLMLRLPVNAVLPGGELRADQVAHTGKSTKSA